MTAYYIPPGRGIVSGGRVLHYGDPLPAFTAEQIDRYVVDGSLAAVPPAVSPSPDSLPAPSEAPAPVESDAVPPADDEGAGAPLEAFTLPDKFPASSKMSAHLKGKPLGYVRAMRAKDGRSGVNVTKAYNSALKALGVSL